jgi:murein DD-endopeptidase MepM/ murein hydrolase activator NlpD
MDAQEKRVKRYFLLGFVGLLVSGALAAPWLASAAPDRAGPADIAFEFSWIRQGNVGIVRVTGIDIAEVRAVFQERLYHFYPDRDAFIGVISADMDEDVGSYPMQIWINYTDGQAERVDKQVDVNYGEFGRSDVTVSASLMPLLDPELEQAEADKLANILERFTPERYWEDEGFIVASGNEVIGGFGAWRLYNGTYWRRHTGTDIRMPIGTPIVAVASGRVVLSEMLQIRGGYVMIDHGWGIYSGYAHMSQRLVVPGQWVRQGDVIGLSGMNGRSTGPHLHWEMAIGGAWVQPEDFVALGLGGTGNN